MRKPEDQLLKSRKGAGRADRSDVSDLCRLFPFEKDIPGNFRLKAPLDSHRVLIDGEIRRWKGPVLDVHSPIRVRKPNGVEERRIGSYPSLTGREALEALDAARRAFSPLEGKWASMPFFRRARCVERFLEKLAARSEDVVRILMWEIAKPYPELEDELERTIGYAETVIRTAGEREKRALRRRKEKGIVGLVRDEPFGVALCLGPYNYPLFETLGLVLPALLAGNTVIVKPPKFGVLFFDSLLEDFQECFPPGRSTSFPAKARRSLSR